MTPESEDKGWRFQAIQDLREDQAQQHKRLRDAIDKVEQMIAKLDENMRALDHAARVELKEAIADVRRTLVSSDRFSPVERGFYGLCGVLLLGIIAAVIKLVLKS